MTWGFLSTAHILSLVIGILIVLVLYFLLRGRSKRLTIAVLGILSFSGIAALIYNLVSWGAPLEYLPLQSMEKASEVVLNIIKLYAE